MWLIYQIAKISPIKLCNVWLIVSQLSATISSSAHFLFDLLCVTTNISLRNMVLYGFMAWPFVYLALEKLCDNVAFYQGNTTQTLQRYIVNDMPCIKHKYNINSPCICTYYLQNSNVFMEKQLGQHRNWKYCFSLNKMFMLFLFSQ